MGALGKLTRQQVAIIGSVLTVLVAVGLFFFLIRPLTERMKAADDKYAANEATAVTRPQAEAERNKAFADARSAQLQWSRYERQYMPNGGIDISNLLTGMQQRWREQNVVLGPKLVHFLHRDRSVRVDKQALAVPAPPTDPNAVNTRVVVLPLGNVSVQGTFRNILKHAERWNRFDRLVLVDNLTLDGYSPHLGGQYTLTCYLFTRGKAGPAIPTAGTASGSSGYPGGPGMPGMPPGAPEGSSPPDSTSTPPRE